MTRPRKRGGKREGAEWSTAYQRLIRLALAGSLAELSQALAQDTGDLRSPERLELEAMIGFQSGKLRSVRSAPLWQRAVWRLWVDAPLGRSAVRGLLCAAAACVGALRLEVRVFDRLRAWLAPAVVHYRYTNFIGGLVGSALLSAFAPPRTSPAQSAYYTGLVGMFECLSGRFDLGLGSLCEGFAVLSRMNRERNPGALRDPAVYERFLCVAVLRALYLGYAGRHAEAYEGYAEILEHTRTLGRYILIEIFLHSMKMFTDLESLDAASLARSDAALKALLGAHFAGKFGLRAAIYAGVVATIGSKLEQDSRSGAHLSGHARDTVDYARQQLALSDELYSDNLAAIELSRYHFLRALVHLELSELGSANLHARRGEAFVANVPGSRYHEEEMHLLRVELLLRGMLRTGGVASNVDLRAARRALARVQRRVRGSALVSVRARALEAFALFLSGDFRRVTAEVPLLCEEARAVSQRLYLTLAEIDTRAAVRRPLVSNEADVRRRHELSLLERFGELLGSDGGDEEAGELLAFLTGAESCEAASHAGDHSPASGVDVSADESGVRVLIPTAGGERVFVLRRPLVDLRFDRRAADLVHLAAEMVRVASQKKQLVELARHAAIARTTQMLAHDVRAPFRTLTMGLQAIRAAESPDELRATVETVVSEVERASASVTSLLADVMEFGSDKRPDGEPVWLEALLAECLCDVLSLDSGADISLEYAFEHGAPLLVDAARVRRVLVNVLTNAVQALRGRGRLWVRSREVADGPWICVTIGNDGPPIAAADLANLFDAFFTKDKPAGTGLGLAIAHHVVSTHGGRIWCTSTADAPVEFHFTLPAAEPASTAAPWPPRAGVRLPAHCRDVGSPIARPRAWVEGLPRPVAPSGSPAPPAALVALVDDSRVFLLGWRTALSPDAEVLYFRSPAAFWEEARRDAGLVDRLDAVITDFRFADTGDTGVSFAKELRARRPSLPICMSSSGMFTDADLAGAIDVLLDKSSVPWQRLRDLIAEAGAAGTSERVPAAGPCSRGEASTVGSP